MVKYKFINLFHCFKDSDCFLEVPFKLISYSQGRPRLSVRCPPSENQASLISGRSHKKQTFHNSDISKHWQPHTCSKHLSLFSLADHDWNEMCLKQNCIDSVVADVSITTFRVTDFSLLPPASVHTLTVPRPQIILAHATNERKCSY